MESRQYTANSTISRTDPLLTSWAHNNFNNQLGLDECKHDRATFPHQQTINDKVSLVHVDDIARMEVEVIVNSTNELISESTGSVLVRGGGKLRGECLKVGRCATGGAVITRAGDLPASYVIHTVAPRYKIQYHNAAAHALHSCYRKSLQLMVENHQRVIAFPVINTERKGFPFRTAVHIALRTIRRFLEQYSDKVDLIIFAIAKKEDLEIYNEFIPLYFPRDCEEEKYALDNLPDDTGDELGDIRIEGREIRIKPRLMEGNEQHCNINLGSSFTKMRENPDDIRRKKEEEFHIPSLHEIRNRGAEVERRYASFLRRSKSEPLGDITKLNFLYHSGYDNNDRPIIVFIAKQLMVQQLDVERVMLYMIHIMHEIVQNEYVLVYVNTGSEKVNHIGRQWLQEFYSVFPAYYFSNMARMYIVQPNVWTKIFVYLMATVFIGRSFPSKVTHIGDYRGLFQLFDPHDLKLPYDLLGLRQRRH